MSLASLSLSDLLMKRRSLRRSLATRKDLQPIRIAVLGGSTTTELVNLLDLYLLESGFAATFHQSEYGRYHVDAVHDSEALLAFRPDIVCIHTSVGNILGFPPLQASDDHLKQLVTAQVEHCREIWDAIEQKIGCVVIQNNFEFPQVRSLGNMDATSNAGRTHFVLEVNRGLAIAARGRSKVYIQDVCSLAAGVGLEDWFDHRRWFSYKIATTLEGSRTLAISLSAMIRALYGKVRKVLVLDLDNTLWGGVIGDDGVDKIQIGRETPVAEAYTAFQEYCLSLRDRGILLAVCSKNDEDIAKQGFSHPDSVLKLEHIACFKANWDPKPENIVRIAQELNLGADSFVFVDDNPAERAIVEAQVEGIAVPDVGDDVVEFVQRIECGRYFEQVLLSSEDLARSALYAQNLRRDEFQQKFADYGEYLDSLEMCADIGPFKSVYNERIAQLTNKTNQFNLTTRRYTLAEIERIAVSTDHIGLYGKLSDRFGDHGLISVVLGRLERADLHLDLWLMSCRVLKRDMEVAMLDALVEAALASGVQRFLGYYLPTKKNGMVAGFYEGLGFVPHATPDDLPQGSTAWSLDLTGYVPRNRHIKPVEPSNA
jgi:FkbH-like protein